MRAWQVQGKGEPKDVLHLVDLPVPEPGPGQMRIAVTAAGLGLPDVFMCRDMYPLTPSLPFTSGQEATGVVTALGEGVDQVAVGDHIMCVTSFIGGDGPLSPGGPPPSPGALARSPGLAPAPGAGGLVSPLPPGV